MSKLVSKILIVLLLFSFASEMAVTAVTPDTLFVMTETEDSEEKKEEKTEKEENKDKISSVFALGQSGFLSNIIFLRNHFFKTSAFKSLPDIPPDQA